MTSWPSVCFAGHGAWGFIPRSPFPHHGEASADNPHDPAERDQREVHEVHGRLLSNVCAPRLPEADSTVKLPLAPDSPRGNSGGVNSGTPRRPNQESAVAQTAQSVEKGEG